MSPAFTSPFAYPGIQKRGINRKGENRERERERERENERERKTEGAFR